MWSKKRSYLKEKTSPEIIRRGLFLSVFTLHRVRTEELYFITLVLIITVCSPVAG